MTNFSARSYDFSTNYGQLVILNNVKHTIIAPSLPHLCLIFASKGHLEVQECGVRMNFVNKYLIFDEDGTKEDG